MYGSVWPSDHSASSSTITTAVGSDFNIVIGVNIFADTDTAIAIIVAIVRVVTKVSRSSLLLFHSHDSVLRHHGFTCFSPHP